MSSTPSKLVRGSSVNGAAPRTRSQIASTSVSTSRSFVSSPFFFLRAAFGGAPRDADRRDGDDLLGEHVERIARVIGLLDVAGLDAGGGSGAREQILLVLRDEHARRDAADMVARATDALDARRDGRRRLDLDDLIDGAHVDAELERRGRDDGRELARFQALLDRAPAVLRDGAVVRERDLLARRLVERGREPLREAAAVDEDHRRARGADALDEPHVELRPDRSRILFRDPLVDRLLETIGKGRRHLHRDGERLLCRGIDDGDGTRRKYTLLPWRRREAAEKARDLLERALRRGQADALERALGRRSASSRSSETKEVGAALARGHLVDLVDDDGIDRREELALRATSSSR